MKQIIRRQQRTRQSVNTTLHRVLQRVISQRDCAYTEYALRDLEVPDRLLNIEKTAQKIFHAIVTNTPILIVGDYDCDGATATALAMKGLELLGHASVDYLIPNRFKSGYGLSTEIVDLALARTPRPALLLTVDNGISSIAGVAYAKSRGLDVVITDHHLPGETLPDTETIVNPQLPDDPFPSKAICGVGVIFYLLLAVRKQMLSAGRFCTNTQPNFMQLIDLVTIGTIADCVPLDKNNRILIAAGLGQIRRNAMSPGVAALLKKQNCVQLSLPL